MRPTTNEDAFIKSAVRALHRAQTSLSQDVVETLESTLDAVFMMKYASFLRRSCSGLVLIS